MQAELTKVNRTGKTSRGMHCHKTKGGAADAVSIPNALFNQDLEDWYESETLRDELRRSLVGARQLAAQARRQRRPSRTQSHEQ